MSDNLIPEEIKYKGKRPSVEVEFKKSSKFGVLISKDVGGLSLVATWVRTDSFDIKKNDDSDIWF